MACRDVLRAAGGEYEVDARRRPPPREARTARPAPDTRLRTRLRQSCAASEGVRDEEMPARVAVEAPLRAPARRSPNPGVSWPHDVQRIITRLPSKWTMRLVSADAAQQLPEAGHRAGHQVPGTLAGCSCRESLRIVRDHGLNPLSLWAVALLLGRQRFLVRPRSTSGRGIKRYATGQPYR